MFGICKKSEGPGMYRANQIEIYNKLQYSLLLQRVGSRVVCLFIIQRYILYSHKVSF